MSRLHRRFFGPLWPGPSPDVDPTFSAVALSQSARATLMHQLTAPGAWRAGILFGQPTENVLNISIAAPNGYRIWDDPVLEGNSAYQLGWADALLTLGINSSDWVGNWIMQPDNRLPSLTAIEHWAARAAASGLLEDTTILLATGLMEGRLEMRAYSLLDEQLVQIDVND